MAKEIRLETENPNITIVHRWNNGVLEIIREVVSSTGEFDITESADIKKTEETITITRTIIQTIS
jgi:hypothetical protein